MARPSSTDVREAPIYTAAEAAHYLRLPASTVRAWAFGQRYGWKGELRSFQPVISAADRKDRRLSFINLVDLFVLAALRRTHSVGLPHVLSCIERDPRGIPMKLYLVPRKQPSARRSGVVIDPRVGFGRPVLDGTGIRTEVLVERFSAGERIEELAADYGRSPAEIEDVVRCELSLAA